jgi:signal transduction histidine kinase
MCSLQLRPPRPSSEDCWKPFARENGFKGVVAARGDSGIGLAEQLQPAAITLDIRAEAASRSKGEFVATLSHEPRNPLNAIVGWARMLRSRVLDRKRFDRALDALERNAQVQAKLVEDLLDISRIIAGKLQLHIQPTGLTQVVTAASDTVRPTAEAKGVRLQVSLDPAADEILADPDRLQQVVWNLLSNAIKFTAAGGKVELRSAPVGSEVEIRVSDTGVGIAAGLMPHVFDRFR